MMNKKKPTRGQRSICRFAMIAACALLVVSCKKPPTVDSLMADAKQYQKQGETNAAIIKLKNVLQEAPDNGEARYILGDIFLKTGDAKSAEKQFREALRIKYDVKQVLPLLAQSLFQQGEFKQLLDETRSSDYGEVALQPEI